MDTYQGTASEPKDCNVHARHPTVFPVGLPPWFGDNKAKMMVERFEKILLRKMTQMVVDRSPEHQRFPSLQSTSGTSVVDDDSPIEGRDKSLDFTGDPWLQLPVASEET